MQTADFNDNFASTTKQPTNNKGKDKGKGKPKDPNTQQINENTESYRNFARRFRNSPITKKDYTAWLRRFVSYCNLPEIRAKIKDEVNDNTDLLLFDNDTKKIQNIIKKLY